MSYAEPSAKEPTEEEDSTTTASSDEESQEEVVLKPVFLTKTQREPRKKSPPPQTMAVSSDVTKDKKRKDITLQKAERVPSADSNNTDEFNGVDDTDYVDVEAEYEAWVEREKYRQTRDRNEAIEKENEKENEIRRRNRSERDLEEELQEHRKEG